MQVRQGSPKPVQTARLLNSPIPLMESCRERYGGTFTLNIWRSGELVFISDPPSIKALFAADRANIIAPGRNILLEPLLGKGSLLLQEDEEHLSRRKMMLPPFHGERMRAYAETMQRATEREVASWPLGEPFRLHPHMQAITLDVIMRAVFGVDEARRERLRRSLSAILATSTSPIAIALTVDFSERLGLLRKTREAISARLATRTRWWLIAGTPRSSSRP